VYELEEVAAFLIWQQRRDPMEREEYEALPVREVSVSSVIATPTLSRPTHFRQRFVSRLVPVLAHVCAYVSVVYGGGVVHETSVSITAGEDLPPAPTRPFRHLWKVRSVPINRPSHVFYPSDGRWFCDVHEAIEPDYGIRAFHPGTLLVELIQRGITSLSGNVRKGAARH